MHTDFLLDRFLENVQQEAIIWRDRAYSYGWLVERINHWTNELIKESVEPGTVVSIESDFSPNAIALLLALVGQGCIVVPLTSSVEMKQPEFRRIAEVELIMKVGDQDDVQFSSTGIQATHSYLRAAKERGHPGLILFSSGSTGKNKASIHDLVPLLEKFKVRRHSKRCIAFLLFDHIGGINTLFYSLSNAGCVVTLKDRSPDNVCAAIAKYKVQILPTSPTFINLLLLSEAYRRHDMSSLELVTYGTEVMPESTLARFHSLFPHIRLLQTYGLSEVGILRSKSKSSESLWMKIGGEGFETRVVDGMLEIKAQSAMMGYLNAESPFTEDGWFKTGDAVEIDGEYFRILGRKSEIINVGGEKVYPAEVESTLQLMEGVEDVAVCAEANPITGQIVTARVKLSTDETLMDFRKRMRDFCRKRLSRFKIPQKIKFVGEAMHGERFKKMR